MRLVPPRWPLLSLALPFVAQTLLLLSTHWALVRVYAVYCAPPGLVGLVYTWVRAGSPLCQTVNHVQVGLANNFVAVLSASAVPAILWSVAPRRAKERWLPGQVLGNPAAAPDVSFAAE